MLGLPSMRLGARAASQIPTASIIKRSNLSSSKVGRTFSMQAWKVNDSLDNAHEADIETKLRLIETRVPTISAPGDVLVKVHSTSINPLDLRMLYGYGRRVFDILDVFTNPEARITFDRYPLTLGRDFSGEVVATGPCAKSFKPGDQVFGVVEPQKSGAHAEYLCTPSYCLTHKPENLSHQQAASVPFAALTAYSALCTFGNLSRNNCSGKQVLVIGGTGGVGSLAIQMLKLWGANVTATCSDSAEKIEWLENELLVEHWFCHHDPAQMSSLANRFDFVLDCGNYDMTTVKTRADIVNDNLSYLKHKSQSVYVTLSPPVLANTDKHGLLLGAAQTGFEAICDTLSGLKDFNSARWAFFLPNKSALDYISSLLADEAIKPQVNSVFGYHQMPRAYEQLQNGKPNGKVVVDVAGGTGSGPANDRSTGTVDTVDTARSHNNTAASKTV